MIKNLSDSTSSQHDKKVKKDLIRSHKSKIARFEDDIRDMEQVLGGRGESSIIRYY